jgi:hypothetical protein
LVLPCYITTVLGPPRSPETTNGKPPTLPIRDLMGRQHRQVIPWEIIRLTTRRLSADDVRRWGLRRWRGRPSARQPAVTRNAERQGAFRSLPPEVSWKLSPATYLARSKECRPNVDKFIFALLMNLPGPPTPADRREPLAGACGDRRASAKRRQSQSDSPRCLRPTGPAAREGPQWACSTSGTGMSSRWSSRPTRPGEP